MWSDRDGRESEIQAWSVLAGLAQHLYIFV